VIQAAPTVFLLPGPKSENFAEEFAGRLQAHGIRPYIADWDSPSGATLAARSLQNLRDSHGLVLIWLVGPIRNDRLGAVFVESGRRRWFPQLLLRPRKRGEAPLRPGDEERIAQGIRQTVSAAYMSARTGLPIEKLSSMTSIPTDIKQSFLGIRVLNAAEVDFRAKVWAFACLAEANSPVHPGPPGPT
jgi:hypothetical protein